MPSRLTVVLVSLFLAIPAVVFWLWLVIVPARVAMFCPEECWSDPGGYDVLCINTSLTSVSAIRLTNVRNLWLFYNNITLFGRDDFVLLTELEILTVFYSELRAIDLGAFNGLTKLTELNMCGNCISEIIPNTFENMRNLECLDLSYNRLEHLDIDVFSGLVKLKDISLEGNKLQYVHPDTFLELPNLQNVSFQYNPFLQIPTDRPFIKSHSLSHLDIERCNVNSVSVDTFANVSALEWLDLRYNNLKTVDINILRALSKLTEIYLYDNPLQCDCQLQEVWRWCQDHNIQTAYKKIAPECDTPSEVERIWWGVLEKGQCLQGNIQYYGDFKNTSYSYTPIEDRDMDTEEQEFINKWFKNFGLPVSVVPFIFGTTGNVILIIIITCNKDMRTVPNMYILNLATSDIIYLTVLFSVACASRIDGTWLRGETACAFLPFCYRMSVGLSAYSVAMLSIQRHRVIVNPIHVLVASKPTWRGTGVTICVVWIVAALFALPAARSKNLCYDSAFLLFTKYYQLVNIFELLVSCVFPLCVIAFTYIKTARHLLESSSLISEETHNPQLKKRKFTAKVVLGLTVVFLISYVPYHISEMYFHFRTYLDFDQLLTEFGWLHGLLKIKPILKLFLSLNSCLNPVAVFCTSLAFRRQFKRYLTCCCKAKFPPSDFELARRN